MWSVQQDQKRLVNPRTTGPGIGRVAFLVVVTLALGCGAPEGLQEAGDSQPPERLEIVERSIRYHGWDRLPELEIALTLSSRSGSFGVVAQPGDLFDYTVTRVENGKVRVHHHSNDELSLTVDGEEQPLDKEADWQRAHDYVSARVYFLFLPFRLDDPSARLQDLGLQDWGGRSLHKVRMSFEPGSSTNSDEVFVFWFDPETARLEQFAYTFAGGFRFRKLIDFRRLDDLLFYDQENYGVDRPDAQVDDLTAESVTSLELISVVRLQDITVRAL